VYISNCKKCTRCTQDCQEGVALKTPKKKSNTRAARKQAQKMKIGNNPILQELREANTRMYMERMEGLDAVKELIESSFETPNWLYPYFLRQTREECGPLLTQSELARRSGVSRVLINNYETGLSTPSVEMAAMLYEAMERSGSYTAAWVVIAIAEIVKEIEKRTLEILDHDAKWIEERKQTIRMNGELAEVYFEQVRARIRERNGELAKCPWLSEEDRENLRTGTPVVDGELLTRTDVEGTAIK
jgi:transcriptional regulator with XRE-family HTH domain